MKKITIIIFLLANMSLFAQTTYVPDDNFEQVLINLGYDDVLDDYVLTANISGITDLHLENSSISNLTGIEGFTSLTYLNCNTNQLTSMDLSANTALTNLYLAYNQLTSLDVSANTNLITFVCAYNQLTSLDLSTNASLYGLFCEYNELTSLDVSGNTGLSLLFCNNNQIADLDISGHTALTLIHCWDNIITSIDVSGSTTLTKMYCYNNQLTNINATGCTALTHLDCYDNELTILKVLGCTALTNLICYNNQLTSLELSTCTDLTYLHCYNNQITSLDVSGSEPLLYLYCQANQLISLDLRNGNNESVGDLDATNNPNLTCIFVDDATWSTMNWENIDASSTFVETEAECDVISNIDEINNDFTISPNPISEKFSIHTKNKIESIQVFDVFGKLMKVYHQQNTYSVSGLANGVYIIHVHVENGILSSKIIIN